MSLLPTLLILCFSQIAVDFSVNRSGLLKKNCFETIFQVLATEFIFKYFWDFQILLENSRLHGNGTTSVGNELQWALKYISPLNLIFLSLPLFFHAKGTLWLVTLGKYKYDSSPIFKVVSCKICRSCHFQIRRLCGRL